MKLQLRQANKDKLAFIEYVNTKYSQSAKPFTSVDAFKSTRQFFTYNYKHVVKLEA